MADIEAYDKNKMDAILDDTIQSMAIVGTSPNQMLRLTLEDGTTEDLGPVTGAAGPQGYPGDGIAGVEPLFSSVIPGPWVNIETTANWDVHAPPDWAQLRYRIIGNIVELNGWTKYVGPDESDDPPDPWTSMAITDFEGAETAKLPAEIMPPSNQYRILHAQRFGRYPAQITIGNLGDVWYLFQYTGTDQPPLKKEEWISFTGCTYTI